MKKRIVIVSGLSGAGKTEALQCLEDLGYTVIDNMPLRMVPSMMSDLDALPNMLALGVDARNNDISTHYEQAVQSVRSHKDIESKVVFLSCDASELMRRFNMTRRRHPLAVGRPLAESISLEMSVLGGMREMVDVDLDTTDYKPADLWRAFKERFEAHDSTGLQVFVMSFGFKHGLPREVDMAFDVRYLSNPHWDEDLRPKTGQDPDVQAYIEEDKEFKTGFGNIETLVLHQLTQFNELDRAYVTIGVGCTGGQHRSVMVSEWLAKSVEKAGFNVKVRHRDILKSSMAS